MNLINWLFPNKAPKPPVKSWWEIQAEIDKESNIRKQKAENERIKRFIEREAMDWLFRDENAPEYLIDGKMLKMYSIQILNTPKLGVLMVYDEETFAYKNADIRELVTQEYNRLKAEKLTNG